MQSSQNYIISRSKQQVGPENQRMNPSVCKFNLDSNSKQFQQKRTFQKKYIQQNMYLQNKEKDLYSRPQATNSRRGQNVIKFKSNYSPIQNGRDFPRAQREMAKGIPKQ